MWCNNTRCCIVILLPSFLIACHKPISLLGFFTGILDNSQHVLMRSPGFCRLHPAQGSQQWTDVPEDFAWCHFKYLLLVEDPWSGGEPWLLSESIPIQPTGD